MEDNEKVEINGIIYKYSHYYERLQAIEDNIAPAIACPKCNAVDFQLSYGDYECIANCKCGHSMTVYDG